MFRIYAMMGIFPFVIGISQMQACDECIKKIDELYIGLDEAHDAHMGDFRNLQEKQQMESYCRGVKQGLKWAKAWINEMHKEKGD